MTRASLNATKRASQGKGSNKKLRKDKKIPAVLYGAHIEQQNLSVKENDVILFLNHNHVGTSLDLNIDGESQFVLLKEIQEDPVSRKVIHMDFQAIKMGEALKVTIPIFISGKDALKNYICQEIISEIEISCLPKNLIDHIDVDVSQMVPGDQVLVSDLKEFADPNIDVLLDADNVICLVSEQSTAQEETTEETEVEEEVVEVATEE